MSNRDKVQIAFEKSIRGLLLKHIITYHQYNNMVNLMSIADIDYLQKQTKINIQKLEKCVRIKLMKSKKIMQQGEQNA